MVIGDFNKIRNVNEKEGGASRPPQQMTCFNNAIDFCRLKELEFVGPLFTWIYQRGDDYQISERLDCALMTVEWSLLFPMAKVFHKSTSVLDHSLLLLKFFEEQKRLRKKKLFRFKAMWLKDSRCDHIVESAWIEGQRDAVLFPIVSCLNLCRGKLEEWNRNVFGHVGREIARLQTKLEWLEMQPSDPGIIVSIRQTRIDLICWMEKENAMWKQRAQLDWFREGVRNTGFFHAKALARQKKNTIEGILDSQEVWQEEEVEVEQVFVDYYSELFTSTEPTEFTEILEVVQPKVSLDMNRRLLKEFMPNEVHQALKRMHPQKAHRPDGMPLSFFSIIGLLLVI